MRLRSHNVCSSWVLSSITHKRLRYGLHSHFSVEVCSNIKDKSPHACMGNRKKSSTTIANRSPIIIFIFFYCTVDCLWWSLVPISRNTPHSIARNTKNGKFKIRITLCSESSGWLGPAPQKRMQRGSGMNVSPPKPSHMFISPHYLPCNVRA